MIRRRYCRESDGMGKSLEDSVREKLKEFARHGDIDILWEEKRPHGDMIITTDFLYLLEFDPRYDEIIITELNPGSKIKAGKRMGDSSAEDVLGRFIFD